MSQAGNLSGVAAAHVGLRTERSVIPFRVPVYAGCTLLALVCNYVLGKDMAWDTLNYHLYAGFSALNDRFSQDYFAAGPVAYFNPFVYVPFYALVHAGLSALVICSLFAVLHSIILWLTFELGISVCPGAQSRTRVFAGIAAVTLALINPILLQEIGSCFADITTAEIVLAGWVLLAGAVRAPRVSRVICAGLIIGVAIGLKLTNAVHAIAAFAMLIMLPLTLKGKIRFAFAYGMSLGLGFIVVAAPWSYRLEQMFANPLFPLMNNVFKSPEFVTAPLPHFRFIPESLSDALWRPFAIINPVRLVHEELRAPDLRYALLLVLVIAFFVHWLWQRRAHPVSKPAPAFTESGRVLAALGLGLALDWAAWLSSSGNGRYFLPMACIAAVVIVGLLFRLFADRPKLRNYILAAVFGVQAVQLYMGTEFRWHGSPWGGQWFDIEIPQKLRNESNLYLTVGSQSNSFLAPFLAKGSGLINFSGGYALGPEGANGARIKRLLEQNAPHLRVLVSGAKLYEDAEMRAPRRSQIDDALQRFGLRTDMTDCAKIAVHGLHQDVEIRYQTSEPIEPLGDTTYLVTCHVVPDDTDNSAVAARQHAVDLVLNRLEDACPMLFQPRGLLTERDGNTWQRVYINTDLRAWVSYGWVKFDNAVRSGDRMVFVGRESDWAKSPPLLECGRRNGAYFAKILKSDDGH